MRFAFRFTLKNKQNKLGLFYYDNVLDETMDLNETVLTAVDSELGSED